MKGSPLSNLYTTILNVIAFQESTPDKPEIILKSCNPKMKFLFVRPFWSAVA